MLLTNLACLPPGCALLVAFTSVRILSAAIARKRNVHTHRRCEAMSALTRCERIEVLERLRDARALILRDAEAFQRAALALEHVAQIAGANLGLPLGRCKDAVLSVLKSKHELIEAEKLFQTVLNSRNMAVHDGAWVRHVNTRLVDLFLVLEAAILSQMQTVGDIMVRTPVIAEPWHRVGHARKAMLSHSFSALPILFEAQERKEWKLLTDEAIVAITRSEGDAVRKKRLSLTISEAVEQADLRLQTATICTPEESVSSLLKNTLSWPVLVVELVGKDKRLVGLVTPFDLL
jgi:CBS domain-containing protein